MHGLCDPQHYAYLTQVTQALRQLAPNADNIVFADGDDFSREGDFVVVDIAVNVVRNELFSKAAPEDEKARVKVQASEIEKRQTCREQQTRGSLLVSWHPVEHRSRNPDHLQRT